MISGSSKSQYKADQKGGSAVELFNDRNAVPRVSARHTCRSSFARLEKIVQYDVSGDSPTS